jgi:hypothetical protein
MRLILQVEGADQKKLRNARDYLASNFGGYSCDFRFQELLAALRQADRLCARHRRGANLRQLAYGTNSRRASALAAPFSSTAPVFVFRPKLLLVDESRGKHFLGGRSVSGTVYHSGCFKYSDLKTKLAVQPEDTIGGLIRRHDRARMPR